MPKRQEIDLYEAMSKADLANVGMKKCKVWRCWRSPYDNKIGKSCCKTCAATSRSNLPAEHGPECNKRNAIIYEYFRKQQMMYNNTTASASSESEPAMKRQHVE